MIIGYEKKEHALNAHLAQIAHQPPVTMKNVYNEIPPLGVELLCYNENLKVYYTAVRKNEDSYFDAVHQVAPPTHWMIMPEKEKYKK